MSANIDLILDAGGSGIISGFVPSLTRNDIYNFRIRVQESSSNAEPQDIDLTGATIKLGIGDIDEVPTSGEFKLTLAGPVTSSAISYNATTTQFFNAISAIAGNATVTTYGIGDCSWLVTAATANTALSFGGDFYTLFPTSSVLVMTRRLPASGIKAEQIIQLRRNPAVFTDTFATGSTAGAFSLTKTQDGGSGKNETYQISTGVDLLGGSYALEFGGSSTTAIAYGANAVSIQLALNAITGIGYGNVSVNELPNRLGYVISFTGELGQTNITTPLTADASGLLIASWKTGTVTLATAELDELFVETSSSLISPTLEIELVTNGNPKTLLQQQTSIRRDLITTGSVVPASRESYYTKTEADNLFVEDLTTNVDATNRKLKASNGAERLAWANGIGFFGASAVSQQNGVNVVSGLVNLGLFASSPTYGVLPLSIKTLTTTASINFGTVAGHDTHYSDVVVTGASLNNVVLIGSPAAVSNGIIVQGNVYTNNVVCVQAVNGYNSSNYLGNETYRITVIGY